ncbi:hypothetical protein CSW64_13675 [Caulobacter mirabilis]|uniref:AAA+ ATPase domain-containing protein n=1 Tax=Caulobacter mirabilis TaxID=69666 RepID=A0A2D2AZG4_9CAUL|nr:hypothetical protein CSW64_13675 [Caulobacter mirabilis]
MPGLFVAEILTQRAAFGDPLDDVVVSGQLADGSRSKLHLQIKSELTFTENDEEWVSVLKQGWETFSGTFDDLRDRLGVAISTYSARADKHYRAVLNWAVHSPDGPNFVLRTTQKDFSHKDKQAFVESVRAILASHSGGEVDDDTLWRFLRCFEIIHFDFAAEDGSRDLEATRDRLRGYLADADKDRAADLWTYLVTNAGSLIPVGGGATRATLLDRFRSENLPTGVPGRFRQDLAAIDQESKRALATIKADIHGLRLHREASYQKLKNALEGGRFIQIEGEPGTGKSALLKEVAEEAARAGPIFVLRDNRIIPRGWAAQATHLGVTANLTALLIELGGTADPILFIDGIDKISDPAVQLTINDLVIAIATDAALAHWKILATVREQNLEHIATWLNPDAIKRLPVRSVSVPPLGRDELGVVAASFPRLKPLLLESGNADVILRRPFFFESVLSLAGRDGTSSLPATEVELLKLWWELGGAERADFTPAQQRRNVLLALAERLVAKPDTAISIRDLAPEPLSDLKSAGTIRDVQLGHTVAFSHDIYEEWALTELLIGEPDSISAFLTRTGEPQNLIRPVQLLGSFLLETHPTEREWQAVYEDVSQPALRPIWQRTVLTSCLRSTRTTEILGKLAAYLETDDHDRLKKLLTALRTLEVVPNPVFLDESQTPDLDPDERVKFAQYGALPKAMTWVRFLDWYLPHIGDPPPALIADLLPVFSTWQSTYGGQNVRHCQRIGEIARGWLIEFEEARHPDQFEDHRKPFGLKLDYDEADKLESSLRALLLASAGDVPELVADYLATTAASKRGHLFRRDIVKNSGTPARFVPAAVVDYILTAFLEHPQDHDDEWGMYSDSLTDDLGMSEHSAFYPASPLQPPFLILLRQHEAEGLRLIHGLCNHSIAVWRWAEARGRRFHVPLTPLPLTLQFQWGKQTFWGDDQAYLWFRGLWGNHLVQSGMMALEQWALERLDAGDDFAATFRKVVEGNESVAALGLATSLALAHPLNAVASALPLVTSTHVWKWDMARASEDQGGMPANELADWVSHRHLMMGVRRLNQKPHRRQSIRDLVPYYVFWHEKAGRARYIKGIRSFVKKLPLTYKEEKQDKEHIEDLRERMSWFAEQADPQYWRAEPAGDGNIKIWNDPPSANTPERLRLLDEHALLNRCLALALWSNTSLEAGALDSRFTIAAAMTEAKALDLDELFETSAGVSDFVGTQRKAAIAGAAFTVARFADGDDWTAEAADWCFSVLERAATTPPALDAVAYRGSILSMHPLTFTVHGFAALLGRHHRPRECQGALLNFAVDPLEEIVKTVAVSAKQYASDYPDFYWVLFQLLVTRCIYQAGAAPDYHSAAWDEAEAAHCLALLDAAEAALDSGTAPMLPDIPLPWIEREDVAPEGDDERSRYLRNELTFHWNIAEKAIFPAQVAIILENSERRRQFVRLIGQLVAFTNQKAMPPFAKSRRDAGNAPYEWIYRLFNWTGRMGAHLSAAEVQDAILDPIFAADDKTALLGMQGFISSFMIHALLPPASITPDKLAIWTVATDWVLDHREGRYGDGRYLDRHFTTCATATLFCVHGDFRPLVCGVQEGWAKLPQFLPIIEKAVPRFGLNSTLYIAVTRFLKAGGFDLLPDPGLDWLLGIANAKKLDKTFWAANGDETVELLKALLERKTGRLTIAHRGIISLMSDILVDNGVRGAGFLLQEELRRA